MEDINVPSTASSEHSSPWPSTEGVTSRDEASHRRHKAEVPATHGKHKAAWRAKSPPPIRWKAKRVPFPLSTLLPSRWVKTKACVDEAMRLCSRRSKGRPPLHPI